jgi:hypothetical protein
LKNVLKNISVRLLTIEEKLEADTRGSAMAAAAVHIPEVQRSTSLTPSLQGLRADKTLTAQAEKQVDDVQFSGAGIDYVKSCRRGWFRSVGDIAPSRRVPWPQDFVLGRDLTSKLMYKDLNMFQWCEGYANIVEREPDPVISHLMFDRLMRSGTPTVLY